MTDYLYSVKGSYLFQGEENPFAGIFRVINDNITGHIMDPVSACVRHDVKGEVTKEKDKTVLKFRKIPVDVPMATIHYGLLKSDAGNGLDGHYVGEWQFKEDLIKLDIDYVPGIGDAVVIKRDTETERSNKTQLSLDSKLLFKHFNL